MVSKVLCIANICILVSCFSHALEMSDIEIMAGNGNVQRLKPNQDLLSDYMARGLYGCSSEYVSLLTKIHNLMKEAYTSYNSCEEQSKRNPRTFRTTSIKTVDDLMRNYKAQNRNKDLLNDI
uniref:Uncharacterized protein n=1 Tax=Rhabditophanes sp. KR3021 TaxID=114890 RepID=A0AC35UG69_9BILA